MAKIWQGAVPKKCDCCDHAINDMFVDGKVKHGGWCIMCPLCLLAFGTGLGTGKGQAYRRHNGVWEKIVSRKSVE